MRPYIRTNLPSSLGSDLPDAYVRFIERTFREAWEEYTAAGRPFGETDVALAIWVEFGRLTRGN
jgi:hypothetical protein